MNYHIKIFIISLSLLFINITLGMEKPLPLSRSSHRGERKEQTKLLEIANQSEKFVHIITGSGIEDRMPNRYYMLLPYEDSSAPITIYEYEHGYIPKIITFEGIYTIEVTSPDINKGVPSVALNKIVPVENKQKKRWEKDYKVLQILPMPNAQTVVAIINPDGTVRIAARSQLKK